METLFQSRSIIGDCTLLELRGKGGYGEVWKARKNETGEVVAMKLAHDEKSHRALEREAEVMGHLDGLSAIPRLIEVRLDGETPYLVREWIELPTLRDHLDERGPFSPEVAMGIFIRLGGALRAVEERGVNHGDLKPENILVAEWQDMPLANQGFRLIDFGASLIEPERREGLEVSRDLVTSEGPRVGTPAYMAPEVRDGATPDVPSDIYSWGVIFFEMVTGHRPQGTELPSEVVDLGDDGEWCDKIYRTFTSRRDLRPATFEEACLDLRRYSGRNLDEGLYPSMPKIYWFATGLSVLLCFGFLLGKRYDDYLAAYSGGFGLLLCTPVWLLHRTRWQWPRFLFEKSRWGVVIIILILGSFGLHMDLYEQAQWKQVEHNEAVMIEALQGKTLPSELAFTTIPQELFAQAFQRISQDRGNFISLSGPIPADGMIIHHEHYRSKVHFSFTDGAVPVHFTWTNLAPTTFSGDWKLTKIVTADGTVYPPGPVVEAAAEK